VITMGVRTKAVETDFSDFLPTELEVQLKEAAQVSMGTEINEEDLDNITDLAQQVIDLQAYRADLGEYISKRMQAIAPNLTLLLGDLIGARLIAQVGSLIGLAKIPASSLQLLGAEKALFRALKTKEDTPKYGIIYQASLVGQASPKNKGKISRSLAAKAALSSRVDALSEKDDTAMIGPLLKEIVLERIRELEKGGSSKKLGKPKSLARQERYDPQKRDSTINSSIPVYDTKTDVVLETPEPSNGEKKKKEKKEKKDKKKKDEEMEDASSDEGEKKKEKKKKEKKDKKEEKEKKKKDKKKDKKKKSDDSDDDEPKKKKEKKDKKEKPAKKEKT